jgi:hypothetical protein
MATQVKAPVGASRNALEAWLAGAVDADASLRNNVLHSTHPTLAKIVGRNVPAAIKVTAVEETPTDVYIVRRFEGGMEPVEPQGTQAQMLRTSIHTIAMDNEGFWEQLGANPKPLLEQHLALKLAPEVNVHVLTENATTAYLVLHHPAHLQAWKPPAEVMAHIPVKK